MGWMGEDAMRGVGLLLVVCPFGFGADHPDPTAELAARLKPFVACFSGQQTRYALRVQVDLHVSGRRHKAALVVLNRSRRWQRGRRGTIQSSPPT